MAIDRSDVDERRARIDLMIQDFEATKRRRLARLASAMLQRVEPNPLSALIGKRSKSVH